MAITDTNTTDVLKHQAHNGELNQTK